MRGFLMELLLDGTGTTVRYKQVSSLSEDVIREFYCILILVQVCHELVFHNYIYPNVSKATN